MRAGAKDAIRVKYATNPSLVNARSSFVVDVVSLFDIVLFLKKKIPIIYKFVFSYDEEDFVFSIASCHISSL